MVVGIDPRADNGRRGHDKAGGETASRSEVKENKGQRRQESGEDLAVGGAGRGRW